MSQPTRPICQGCRRSATQEMYRRTAVHEAGHIFMAGILGIKLRLAVLYRCGCGTTFLIEQILDKDRAAMIAVAGTAAQQLFKINDISIYYQDKDLCKFMAGNRIMGKHLWRLATERVTTMWNQDAAGARRVIGAIADKLLVKGEITQDDLADLQGVTKP